MIYPQTQICATHNKSTRNTSSMSGGLRRVLLVGLSGLVARHSSPQPPSNSPAPEATTAGAAPSPSKASKLGYIDALRGQAILLVIACHSFLSFSEPPWPVKRIASLGWHGVQLFFMASAVTLAMSWHRRSETHKVSKFFIRRFFRIWPMYAIAFVFYFFLWPPGRDFSLTEIATTLTFTNGWTAFTMPTLPSAWSPVPGNWSIAAEFGFYLTFPWLANLLLPSLKYSIYFLVFSVLMAIYYNSVNQYFMLPYYHGNEELQFLYYWLPNQMPIFALGFIVYNLLDRYGATGKFTGKPGKWLTIAGVAGFVLLGYLPAGKAIYWGHVEMPIHWLAGFCFVALICGVSGGQGILNNWMIRQMGKVSFSAYLFHFSIIHLLANQYGKFFHLESHGVTAILYSGLFFVCVVIITYSISLVSFKYLETQGIILGRKICRIL